MRELTEATRAIVRSRIPNYGSLDEHEAAVQAIRVIAKDFYIYCERNLLIKDKRGQMVPLSPNWAQKKLVEAVLDDLAHGQPVRYIVLKARQMGLSTIIEALCYWWTTTHRNINSVIIAHEKPAAANLYKMFRRYYENSHPHFQPDRKYNTKNDLTFDVEDAVKKEAHEEGKPPPGLNSEIKTMVAKDGGGRSDTILFFHGSEVAFWEAGSDVLSSALQAVPMLPETFAFLESTANGVGGYFYNEWQFAKKGESAFKPFFFAWHEHPEYMIEGKLEAYDDEEMELLEIFEEKNYPKGEWDKKLIWRRKKKQEFRSEPAKFYQEYPKDDMEAFLASGRPVFDIKQLIKMEQAAMAAPPPQFGILKAATPMEREEAARAGKKIGEVSCSFVPMTFQDQDPTPFKIWELPEEGEKYVVTADVAEGIDKGTGTQEGDYSVIDVTKVSNLKTVARWRGHIDPDLLGDEIILVGTFYNHALAGVEINNHGLTTVQRMRDKFYRNLYMRESNEEDQFQERTTKMGWKTDRKTKPLMIDELAQAVREGDIIDLDIVFIREAMTYVRDDNGHTNAQEGMFDDCVMAKAIGLQLANWSSYALDSVKIHKPIKRDKHGSTNALDSIAAGTNKRHSQHTGAVQRRRETRRRHRTTSR